MGVGARLRAARERRQLTLGAIAATTKIPRLTLEAIEDEAWARIPGGIFTRAYVRSFALEVGLDPDDIVQQYLSEVPEATEDLPFYIEKDPPRRRSSAKLVWGLAVVAVVAGAVAAWPTVNRWMAGTAAGSRALMAVPGADRVAAEQGEAAGQGAPVVQEDEAAHRTLPAAATVSYQRPSGADSASASWDEEPVAADDETAPASAAAAVEPQDPPAEEPPVAVEPAGISIVIEPRADCWVRASVDGALRFARLVRAGERETLEAASVVVMQVGNAGVLDYTVNGQPGRVLGAEGKVVTARIDLETLHAFIAR